MTDIVYPRRDLAEESLTGWTRLDADTFEHGAALAHVRIMAEARAAVRVSIRTRNRIAEEAQHGMALAEERAWNSR